jgi:opacity protein-like surface antigen
MKRGLAVAVLTGFTLALFPAAASADGTFFYGWAPKPEGRLARGFAVGGNMSFVGIEFEYSNIDQVETLAVPGLKTFMFNGVLATPTQAVQLYVTAGGGLYRESLSDQSDTGFGTNFGAGVKFSVAGPLRIRIDYRVFRIGGDAVDKSVQRFYAGANVAF